MKPTKWTKMPVSKHLSGLILAIMIAGSAMQFGCTNVTESNGPSQAEVDSLITLAETLKEDVDSLKNLSVCTMLYPDSNEVTFELKPIANSENWYNVELKDGCGADLTCVSNLCRCKCTLDNIQFENSSVEGSTVLVSMASPGKSGFNGASLPITGGRINLADVDGQIEWEQGLKIQITPPSDGTAFSAGGLCVVINIEGGGN